MSAMDSTLRSTLADRAKDITKRELATYAERTAGSQKANARARKVLPLGVPSSFQAYDPYPIVIASADGPNMVDVDGNTYTDYDMGFGALFVGHRHPAVLRALDAQIADGTLFVNPCESNAEVAEMLAARYKLPMWRFTNSGTEATMDALRVARAATGRHKICKVEGGYHGHHDEVMISIHNLNEIWIISRKTGDIVYRYGSPANYKSGTPLDQVLFGQHDARWLPPDSRKVMIFNNGVGRKDPPGSSVDEIELPIGPDGTYLREAKKAFAPSKPVVVYHKTLSLQFFAANISGATRLPNGNALSCLGPSGTFVESTPDGQEVWRYVNPVSNTGITPQGQTPRNNMVFKIYRYGPDYPAFAGKSLVPRGRLEDGPLSVLDPRSASPSAHFLDILNHRVVLYLVAERPIIIDAYDILGRHLGSTVEESLTPGTHVRPVPEGTMVVRIR
ncbi:MAG: aminotransferase class III-fold pyridoxal phosphate-dependent enzyme [Actinobacteria bacterium]|nr:aminotransferase class III-fold pyridoxal phosphate-dependent enzyme [Actinomycetota bacterium]